MLSNIRKHLTPSTGIALIALVFALTSGAFAATGGGSPGNTTMGGSSRASDQTLALISKAKTKAKAGPRAPLAPKEPLARPAPRAPRAPPAHRDHKARPAPPVKPARPAARAPTAKASPPNPYPPAT